MRPLMKVSDPEGDILLADSGAMIETFSEQGQRQLVYRTGFAIMRGKVWTASTNEYHRGQPEFASGHEGQQRRINDCLLHARKQMKDCLSVGLYDGQRRISKVTN